MKISPTLPFILVIIMSCHSPAVKPVLKAVDTTKAISHSDPNPEKDSVIVLKTHLRDTTYADGNFILFLRPDDGRYGELEKMSEDETGSGDADFGAGISSTQDSLKQNDRYKGIKVLISTRRYICIMDCKDGPLIVDRDSASYGFILSATGRPIAKTYNSVHGGDYLEELDEYFSLR